jgi:hypothetical protein
LKIACWDYIPVWEIRFGVLLKNECYDEVGVDGSVRDVYYVPRTYIGICVCMSYRRTCHDIKKAQGGRTFHD